jgi:hypothetical protein
VRVRPNRRKRPNDPLQTSFTEFLHPRLVRGTDINSVHDSGLLGGEFHGRFGAGTVTKLEQITKAMEAAKAEWCAAAGSFNADIIPMDVLAVAAVKALPTLPDSFWEDGAALDPDVIGYDRDAETYWEAIIDAILKEKP